MARDSADPDRTVELLWREGRADPRPGLSLDRIVEVGVELADAEGLAGLSMRKVAERLGFTTMSLYRHVPGRDQLIDLMRDAVAAETAAGADPQGTDPEGTDPEAADPEAAGWRTRLEACVRDGWELRRRHPWLAEVRGGRHVPGPHGIAYYDRLLSTVVDTGLTAAEVIAAIGLVARFLDSEALLLVEAAQAQRRTGVSDEQWWGDRQAVYDRLTDHPTITRLWVDGGYDHPADPFEFGLARLLDGIGLLIQERYVSRYENGRCVVCGGPVEQTAAGRPRRYCSSSCRQRAYRSRRAGRDRAR